MKGMMTMKSKKVFTALGVTMAVGSAAMLAGGAMMQPNLNKRAMKTAQKAIRRAESLFDDVQDLLK